MVTVNQIPRIAQVESKSSRVEVLKILKLFSLRLLKGCK